MGATKRVVQRYECAACGYRWSRDFKAPMALDFPQPSAIYMVPRHAGACECDESASDGSGGYQSAFGEVE